MITLRTSLLSAVAFACLWPSAALAGKIKVASVTASSSYAPDADFSYDAKNVIDGKAATGWVEGDQGSGLGSWVELNLGGEKVVSRVKIWGGMWYSATYWDRSNRPKQLEARFSDGSTQTFDLANEQKVQEFKLSAPKKTSTVRLTMKSVHSGSTWPDTAISEVQLFDGAADTAATSVTASSEAPADGDGDYKAINVADGLIDTMWCEGNKEGDGTGEWIELKLPGDPTVSKLHLLNGMGGSMVLWFKGNRATHATLTFSDGSTHATDVKNSFKTQEISFPAKSTSSVRITFDTVAKGKEYNDLCISEAYFTK